MKNYHKSYYKKSHYRRLFRLIIIAILYSLWSDTILSASGGYDNGTATGKGKLGVDITWNPFNYFPQGQSYIVVSYGFLENFDLHGYYSKPSTGSDNYYVGLFYQFFRNNYLDLATAIGIRQYKPKSHRHLFMPQLLFTLNVSNGIRLGGSMVAIRDIDRNNKLMGTTLDVLFIIPLFKNSSINDRVNSVDFCIGAFKPVMWTPTQREWHPTYSFDIKFNL